MEICKVITVKGKLEVYRGSYAACKEYVMTHMHIWGYMDIIPI